MEYVNFKKFLDLIGALTKIKVIKSELGEKEIEIYSGKYLHFPYRTIELYFDYHVIGVDSKEDFLIIEISK